MNICLLRVFCRFYHNKICLAISIALLGLSSSITAQSNQNLTYLIDKDLNKEELARKTAYLKMFDNVENSIIFQLSANELQKRETIQFANDDQYIKLKKDYLYIDKSNPTSMIWVGKTEDNHQAELYISNQEISGDFRYEKNTYYIKNLNSNKNLLISTPTVTKMPAKVCGTNESKHDAATKISMPVIPKNFDPRNYSVCNDKLRLMIVYTPDIANKVPDITKYCKDLITAMNKTYADSKVYHSVELAYSGKIEFDEAGDIYDNLYDFKTTQEAVDLRLKYKADVGILLVDDIDGFLGKGNVYTDFQNAYVIVTYNNKIKNTNHTMCHEIGHLYGCGHNNTENDYYSYGVGFTHFYDDPKFATLDYSFPSCYSYSEDCEVIPYYSNPDVIYKGIAIGDEEHNNAAVMNIRSKDMINMYSINNIEWPYALIKNKQYASVKAESLIMNLAPDNNDEDPDNDFFQQHNFTVKSGGEAVFTCRKIIKLAPGFHAQTGSKFTAHIDQGCDVKQTALKQANNEISTVQNSIPKASGSIDIKAYPNPFTNEITLKIGDKNISNSPVDIKICNITGGVVLQTKQQHVNNGTCTINTSSLKQGIYYCIITLDNKQYIQKIIKL